MRILVDADACPVIEEIESVGKQRNLDVVLFCDTNHILASEFSEVKFIGAGADAVDFALVNDCQKGDIVVTQDYGLAAMVLAKGGIPIHQNGWLYTDENLDNLLYKRYVTKALKKSGRSFFGGGSSRKRAHGDNMKFMSSLLRVVDSMLRKVGG